jgi:short-subunit dehydrogenase
MQVSGKTFVVTGGGSGMGQELVLLLLEKGGTVAAVDIKSAGLDETKVKAGVNAARLTSHIADISNKTAVYALKDEVLARHGHVDGVFNNAGIIQPFKKVAQLDDATIERVMNVNFYGTVHLTRAFLPHLLERPEAHIVNTSSMGGFLPVPGQAIYGASKAAVKLFTEALYAELLETRVRVTAVFPGAIATHITENSGVTVPKAPEGTSTMTAMPASEAAKAIVKGMEDDEFHVLVGSDSYLMDKLSRLMPEKAVKIIQKRMKSLLPD